MVQVPDWSKDEFENRSGSLARLIRLAWRAIARAFAGRLESQAVATSADVAGLPAAWDMEVEAQILGYVTDTYLDAASKMRIELDAPDDFIPTDDLVAAYLRTARNRLKNIGDDVWEVVSEQLIQGISAGESIPELAARVRSTAGVSDARSLTIARTEVHAAHEAGSYDQALFVDPTATKVWLATEDARTRPTHQAAEGQRRRINESFEVGGAALRYPGDPLGPADEVINCRCTTVYDFSTLDSVTSDDPELALVAASKKKWTPSKHPRGSDGKFIKKGAVADLLSKPKPELLTVSTAIDELTEKSWGQLTDAQQDYIMDSYGKLPKGSYLEKHATEKLSKIGALKAQPAATEAGEMPAVPKAKVLAQAAPKANKAAKTILEADDFAQLGNQKYKKPLGKTGKPLRVGFLGDDGSITAHVGLKPGEPTKSSTFLIWGKYPPGTTILEGEAGKASVVWNGKKYEFREEGQTTQVLGKQAAYDKLHSQDGWVVPKYEGQPVDQPGVLTELVEGYQEPDDEVDTDLPGPAPTPEPTSAPEPEPAASEVPEISDVAPEPDPEPISAPEPEPEPEPVSEPEPVAAPTVAQVPAGLGDELDFGGYQKIGGQGGSNPGGVFEAPDGTREYIKKAKSEQHAANEVAASAFYNLAGISTPQVRKGHGAPGIGGGLQTGTKLVPGAKSDLKSKMQDPEYKKEIQSGFVVDAWLANWDVAGLVYDNIVTGEDGKPYRIDVGGALLFRAQGAPKGGAFGPTVTELDTLRNVSMNKQSASLFGDMTDEEIAQAAQRVTSITDEQIDQIVADSGLPSSVAQTLKARRDYIGEKYPAPTPVSVPDVLAEEEDVVQQLIDGTFTDPAGESLNKLKTSGEQLSNAESVQLAQGITQEEYNSLTKDQRLKLAAGVDASLDDSSIDNTDAWLAFNRLSDLVVYATPAPAPPTPAMQIPTPEPTVQLPPGASFIGEGLEDTHWSDLTQNAANGLYPAGSVVAQTADGQFKLVDSPSSAMGTWSLQDAEGNHLETFTDANVEAGYPEDYGSTPWHSVPPAPAVVEDDEDANELPHDSAWADLFDANAYPSQPVVIAESSPGNYRVVAQPNNTFSLEVNDGGVWIDIETFDPNVSEESFSEIAESHASGWHAITPVAVPATFPTPPAPASTGATPALTLPDTTWTLSAGKSKAEIEAYTSFNHPAGTILGITPDANMQVVSVGDGSYVLQMLDADNNWFDGASVSAGVLASMFNENTWTLPDSTFDAAMPAVQPSVPAWKLVPAIDPPEGTVYEPVEGYLGVLDDYVNFDHPAGTVIALRNVNGVNVRIVKTGLDAPEYKTQLQSLSDGQWYDNNAGDVSAALVINQLQTNPWLLPQSALLPALGPKTTPVGPSSPNVTPVPATSGADTSSIPTFYKKSWKKKLSAAKVGYYSAPAKIWDQIKEIQAQYPDPANPGQSKYTPLQIIKSLDDVYTGKKEQNPYETKMVAWAATSKGKAYTGNTGTSQAATPNTPAATQTAPPPDPQLMAWTPENTGKLFDAVQDMELGTVLATNIDTKGGQFQIVVGDQAGVKTPHLQYKPAGETAWQPSIFMPDKQGFIKGMDIDFGNGPWKSAVILLPNGGISPAPNLAPSPKATSSVTLPATAENAGLIWDKLDQFADGTVVGHNPGGVNQQYRWVVASDPNGTKYLKIQKKSKADPNAEWTETQLSIDSKKEFQDDAEVTLGSNSWTITDPSGSIVTPTPASAPTGPPPPKPFKATVKAIYAAMPTYQVNKPVATAEFNGEQYALVPGFGKTKKGYASTKKKLILKKKSPYGDYWVTVEPLDTQAKLGQILKDFKYAWVEAAETPAVPPPSVSAPVKASKPTVSVGVFKNTPEDIGNLWDSLNEIGDGMILADGTPNGVPTKIMSKIAPDGSVKVEAHTQTGVTPFASSKEDLVSKLNSDATWTITASKSPLFGAGEIANLSEDQQQGLYADFKKQPATYLKSPAQDIYAALSTIASDNGLTLLQMLRVVDAVGAKKVSKPDEHLFEKKIKDWLQTPQGAAVASGKPIPLPVGPALSPGVSLSGVPSFEESNQYSYKVISTTEATKLGNDFKKQSEAGDWTQAQHDGLQAYTGGIYYSINQYYYGKLPSISSTNEKAAKNAQLGMRPSTVPLLLHRGTGFDGVGGASSHADLLKMVGSTFFSGGFFSTSVGGSAAFGGKSVILEIEAPPGTPMAYLKNISLHKSENEMLLAAGLSYRIQEVRKEGSKSVVRVRVVPPDKPFPWETSVEG